MHFQVGAKKSPPPPRYISVEKYAGTDRVNYLSLQSRLKNFISSLMNAVFLERRRPWLTSSVGLRFLVITLIGNSKNSDCVTTKTFFAQPGYTYIDSGNAY